MICEGGELYCNSAVELARGAISMSEQVYLCGIVFKEHNTELLVVKEEIRRVGRKTKDEQQTPCTFQARNNRDRHAVNVLQV